MATHLQSKQLDASTVKTTRGGLLRHLNDMRSDSFFDELYNVSNTICQELEGDVDIPKFSSELNLIASFMKEVQPDLKGLRGLHQDFHEIDFLVVSDIKYCS